MTVWRMKASTYLFWVLGAIIAIACVDTIPDPPALNPHSVNVIASLCEPSGGACEQPWNSGWFCFSSQLQATRIAVTLAYEPSLPRDWIVLTGQAADSSPPAFKSLRKFYF